MNTQTITRLDEDAKLDSRVLGNRCRFTGVIIGRNEEQFYMVVVSTEKSWLGEKPGQYPITPGMLGEVDIKIDSQPILWSLLKPVLKIKSEAFREI